MSQLNSNTSKLGERDLIWVNNGSLGTLPAPSIVESEFWKKYKGDKSDAIKWYYNLETDADYIKVEAAAKNIKWTHPSSYGDLQISINLSKPEKDPKQIALDALDLNKKANNSLAPKCHLCLENEGYNDDIHQNMRVIRIPELEWCFQYSPYIYYNEHCIVLDANHTPMQITKQTFGRLLELLDIFPGYFFGSNSDIPIVGGSILGHDHFQGGKHHFPIEDASVIKKFTHSEFKNVRIELIDWPLTTFRARSRERSLISEFAEHLKQEWIGYENLELDIIKQSNGERHNAITPIVRKKDDFYEMDIVLRNNRTTDEFPLGIFHPHPEFHHIKKENIGLIEVAGLAILPPRLKNGLDDGTLIKSEIGEVFSKVLYNCGVFKLDTKSGLAGAFDFATVAGLVFSNV